jgi:hypothetical protein
MAAPQPGSFLDTIGNSIAGMHSGIPPTLLSKQHVAFSVNITHRGGMPRTRPSFVKRLLVFADDESDETSTDALFQRASYYRGYENNPNAIVALIGGKLFRYIPQVNSVNVSDISPPGPINDPTAPLAWLWQGEEFLIVQNGLDLPMIFDGSSTRRSAGPAGNELPAGTVGTYSNGRIVMALPDRRSYIASDLVYNTDSGTALYNYRDAILKTKDNEQILAGRAFAIPINAGSINAMFSVAIPDTSLGQGTLQIGTRTCVFGVNLPLDATLWTTLQQPTQVVSLPSAGPLSQDVAIVNMDGWYRSRLGIQSYQVGRRDMGTWVQTAQSAEMIEVIKYDSDPLLDHCSVVEFDNRLLVTASPYRESGRGVPHRGIIALDFHNISSLTTRSNPDYDGLWTGMPVLQIVRGDFGGKDRCFAFALDSDNRICLYEILREDDADFDYDGTNDISTTSWLISNALFGLEGYPEKVTVPLKKLLTGDMFFESLAGAADADGIISFNVKFRSDAYPFWVEWKDFELCTTGCQVPTDCSQPGCPQFQYATFMRLPDPPDSCNEATGRLHRTGYYFQIRLEWTGHAALEKMLVWATPMEENKNSVCVTQTCKVISGATDDYFDYNIEPRCSLRINTQPEPSTIVDAGGSFELTFGYTGGVGPFTIQWFKDGTALSDGGDISGATTTTLAVVNFAAEDAGSYRATVTDTATPDCEATTGIAAVTASTEDPIIYGDDGGDPPEPDCVNGLVTFFGGTYWTNSWATVALTDPSVNPNGVLSESDIGCAKAMHMAELNAYINDTLVPAGHIVTVIVTFWRWHGTNVGNQKQLYNKIAVGNCDPFDTTGDWLAIMPSGGWNITSWLCVEEGP